jgi:hypothetical protein
VPRDYYFFINPMRRVFFFIFFFTLLLRGVDQVYAGKLVHTTCFLADQEFRKSQKARGCKAGGEQGSIETIHARDVQQDLLFEEIDNNSNNDFARKYKSLSAFFSFSTYNFYQHYYYGFLNDRLPAGSWLYCKYITQRALRI